MVIDAVDTIVQAKLSSDELLSAGRNAELVIRKTLSDNLMLELAQVCPMLKDVAFKSEKESRLVFSKPFSGDKDKRRFRADGGMVVPYKEFLLDDSTLWSNARITIGPPPHLDESLASVYKLLSCHMGYEAIIHSRVPYRTW